MFALLLTTVITCKQAFGLIQRIQSNPMLNETAKTDLIAELRDTIPTCPITIKKDVK